jgi:D-alanine transaminase
MDESTIMNVWLNGEIVAAEKARVSPFDRGFIFGDGVYEVVRFFNGAGFGIDEHVERLRRSLNDARIEGFDAGEMRRIAAMLLDEAGLEDAFLYLQVTRGCEDGRHHVPRSPLDPTVFAFVSPAPSLDEMNVASVIDAVLLPDDRWRRCSIKTTSLMGNVLASLAAGDAGAEEAILHRGGFVGEGSKTNVFMVQPNRLATPPINAEPPILHGVTRRKVLDAARAIGMRIEERPVRVDELRAAAEVFVSSTRRLIAAVGTLDGKPIGTSGLRRAGPVTQRLFDSLRRMVAGSCPATLHSTR